MAHALVHGIGGIGQALALQLSQDKTIDHLFLASRSPHTLRDVLPEELTHNNAVTLIDWDIHKPETIENSVQLIEDKPGELGLVINSAGLLHTETGEPEKRLESFNLEYFQKNIEVNSALPLLTIQAILPLLRQTPHTQIINISAKVGSIDDNGLGGWYSYRASKAALNMLTKTLSIELRRRRFEASVCAIHPGTVATNLSKPFVAASQKNVMSADEAATAILKVIASLTPEDNGSFFSWNGDRLSW